MSLMSSEGSIPVAAASYPFATRLASCGSQAAGVWCWSAMVLMFLSPGSKPYNIAQLFHGSKPYATNEKKKRTRGYLTPQHRSNFTARSCEAWAVISRLNAVRHQRRERKKKKREVISRLKTVTTSLLEAVQHRQFFDVSAPCRTLQSKVISRPYTTAISPVETRATYSHFTT